VLIFSDIAVIFISSIVVLIPNGQFLGCASFAFTERYQIFVIRQLPNIDRLTVPYAVMTDRYDITRSKSVLAITNGTNVALDLKSGLKNDDIAVH
jgi:hypothetical protein